MGRIAAACRGLTGLAVLLVLVLALGLGAARAQGAGEPDYAAWDRLADRGEALVDAGTAPDRVLLPLRAEAVEWRDRFTQAQSLNAPRIATLREQIAALGPAPAEGQTEAEDVAARRKTLNEQLAELQAPGVRAVEALTRANNLVQSIDELQRDRQASAILRLTPSPLLPSSWAAAANEGLAVARGLTQELVERGGAGGDGLRERLPAILGYVILALGLLVFGRRWIDSLPSRLSARANEYSRDALTFAVSLGQIVIPTVGVYLAVLAIDQTGLAGDWGRPILTTIPAAGAILFTGRWLARRFFPLFGDPPICYPDDQRLKGRFYGTMVAVALAAHHVAGTAILPLAGLNAGERPQGTTIPLEFSEAAAGVWHLPIILGGALCLFRLALVLRGAMRHGKSETPNYRLRITAAVGGAARLVAVAAPLMALIGYVSMANALIWPTVMTVALVGAIILLQEFIADLYALAKRDTAGSRDALAPVLIGFGLVLASLPLFALIWGARASDLAEFWARLRQGVSLGGVRLSPGAILTFVLVFGLGYFLTRLIQGTFRTSILPRTRLDQGAQTAAVSGLGYVGIFLAALLAITSAGIDLSSLAIVAGALSVGIGFGLQNIVSNFVSGIILLVERPITVGDWIQVGNAQGYVRRISVRSTQIQTFDRTDVIVPNSDLISQQVTNWTRGNQQGRIIVKVGVAYGTDTRHVARILTDIAEDQPIVLINPPPTVVFTGFGVDSMDFEVRAILSDINQGLSVSTEIRHQIIERFAAEGIEIPFTHREVRIVNPELLQPAQAPGRAPPPQTERGKEPLADEAAAPPRDAAGVEARIARTTSGGIEGAAGDDGETADNR